jgi:hypothetical protein
VVVLRAILVESRVASKQGVLRVDCGRHDGQLVDPYRESAGSDGTDGRSVCWVLQEPEPTKSFPASETVCARAASVAMDGRAMKG